MKAKLIIPLIPLFALLGASCVATESSADRSERQQTDQQAEMFVQNQPAPVANGESQLRQTLNEMYEMQIDTTQTFAYFFAPGREDGAPILACPSIGDPVPASFQLTNPQKRINSGSSGPVTLPQMEPTGVFSGETSATNALCVDPDGNGFKVYWEGHVMSTTLELGWDAEKGMMVIVDGAVPTADFSTEVRDTVSRNTTNSDEGGN